MPLLLDLNDAPVGSAIEYLRLYDECVEELSVLGWLARSSDGHVLHEPHDEHEFYIARQKHA